jgi:WD40 repeat protein
VLQVLEREPERPRALNPRADRDLETVCLRCLEKEPARRYGSAEALADDLERWLKGEPIRARRVGAWERSVKWARRRPAVAALLAAVVLTNLAGLALVTWQWRRAVRAVADRDVALTAKDEALTHIDGLRLTAESSARLPRDPGLALLLAIEGAERGRPRLAAHNNALLAALLACRERRTLFGDRVLAAFGGPNADRKGEFVFRSAQVSADGRRVLTVGIGLESDADLLQTAQVWDTESGRLLCLLRLPHMNLEAVRLSPDGRRVATVFSGLLELRYADGSRCLYTDHAAQVWDADSGKPLAVLRGHMDRVASVAFSPDSHRIVTTSWDRTVRLWDADSGKQLAVVPAGRSWPTTAFFSPDGRRVLTLSTDHIQRSHLDTAANRLPENVDPPLRADPPTDQINLVTGGGSQTSAAEEKNPPARLYDAASGKLLGTLTLDPGGSVRTTCAAFSPDGCRVVTGTNTYGGGGPWVTELALWDARDGKRLGQLETHHQTPPGAVQVLTFSADGGRLLVVHNDVTYQGRSGQLLEVLQVPTGKVLASRSVPVESRKGFTPAEWEQKVRSAQLSPDGRYVLLLLGDEFQVGHKNWHWDRLPGPDSGAKVVLDPPQDSTAHLWDVDTGAEALVSGHANDLSSACFDGDGRSIATASVDGTVRVWMLDPGRDVVRVLRGHPGPVGIARFSPDGRRILTARGPNPNPQQPDRDPADCTARLWDASDGRPLAVLKGLEALKASPFRVLGPVTAAVFSADGRNVLTLSADANAHVRSANGKEEPLPFTQVRLWDSDTGKERFALAGLTDDTRFAALSPDGRYLLTASAGIQNPVLFDETGAKGTYATINKDGVRLWDATAGRLLHRLANAGGVAAAWSPDGRRFALFSPQGSAIWDPETGERVLPLEPGEAAVAAWSPDGRLLLGFPRLFRADRQYVHVWDAATGKKRYVLQGHEDEVTAAAFSPDSRHIVTASRDGTTRIWSAADGREEVVLRGHEGPVYSAAWSPDGRFVVTASEDRTARLWYADSGREFFTLTGHEGPVYSAEFSPDGTQVVTASADGTARIWPADPLPLARQRKPRELTEAERRQYGIESP